MKVPPAPEDFKIAVVCALILEADAVQAVFDSFWEEDGILYGKATHDTNSYTTGMIGDYNVVLAHMPDYGKKHAAVVASNFRHTFPGIKIGFVVGVCGGAPKDEEGQDILLGDVVISTGVVEYDLGHQLPNEFISKNTLGSKLNPELQGFLNQMRGVRERIHLKEKTAEYLAAPSIIRGDTKPKYPGVGRNAAEPCIHYGLIASGDRVVKSGEHRDEIFARTKAIAFEMEGAGVWETIPSFIIKGVCDYADSHKNSDWQPYAAATAAACIKAFLARWRPTVDQPRYVPTSGG
jgi:nucleoside phosphorylase